MVRNLFPKTSVKFNFLFIDQFFDKVHRVIHFHSKVSYLRINLFKGLVASGTGGHQFLGACGLDPFYDLPGMWFKFICSHEEQGEAAAALFSAQGGVVYSSRINGLKKARDYFHVQIAGDASHKQKCFSLGFELPRLYFFLKDGRINIDSVGLGACIDISCLEYVVSHSEYRFRGETGLIQFFSHTLHYLVYLDLGRAEIGASLAGCTTVKGLGQIG